MTSVRTRTYLRSRGYSTLTAVAVCLLAISCGPQRAEWKVLDAADLRAAGLDSEPGGLPVYGLRDGSRILVYDLAFVKAAGDPLITLRRYCEFHGSSTFCAGATGYVRDFPGLGGNGYTIRGFVTKGRPRWVVGSFPDKNWRQRLKDFPDDAVASLASLTVETKFAPLNGTFTTHGRTFLLPPDWFLDSEALGTIDPFSLVTLESRTTKALCSVRSFSSLAKLKKSSIFKMTGKSMGQVPADGTYEILVGGRAVGFVIKYADFYLAFDSLEGADTTDSKVAAIKGLALLMKDRRRTF